MVGMPGALALAATALPPSLLIEAMTSTFTPLEIIPSARAENFCSSPWAFWMSGSRTWDRMALSSSGLSNPSQRADVSVSGRMTPTLIPSAGAALWPPLPELLALFCHTRPACGPQDGGDERRPRPAHRCPPTSSWYRRWAGECCARRRMPATAHRRRAQLGAIGPSAPARDHHHIRHRLAFPEGARTRVIGRGRAGRLHREPERHAGLALRGRRPADSGRSDVSPATEARPDRLPDSPTRRVSDYGVSFNR